MRKSCQGCMESRPVEQIKKRLIIGSAGYDNQGLRYLFNDNRYDICDHCVKSSYLPCKSAECESLVGLYDRGRYGGYCCKCGTSDAILAFNYDPCKKLKNFYNTFGQVKPAIAAMQGDLYLGVELEVVINPEYSTRKVADETQAAIGDKFAVLKYDGTVNKNGTRGFEIVSAPATMDFQKTAWKNFFEFAGDTKYFLDIHPSCGMHVHMSRTALDNAMINRMVQFVYSAHNQAFIKEIAQRSANQYCDYSPKSAGHVRDHYTALNRAKKQTVELRIFQGIVDAEMFNKNVEFCHAMYSYVKDTKSHLEEDFHFEKFIPYVQGNNELYPNLSKYLGNLSCIKKKRRIRKPMAPAAPAF